MAVKAPDTITTWQLEGLSLSQDRGLALADPVQLRTYKAFFVDFKLPYSVVRGEQVKIPLTVYNYLHSCVRVGNATGYTSLVFINVSVWVCACVKAWDKPVW